MKKIYGRNNSFVARIIRRRFSWGQCVYVHHFDFVGRSHHLSEEIHLASSFSFTTRCNRVTTRCNRVTPFPSLSRVCHVAIRSFPSACGIALSNTWVTIIEFQFYFLTKTEVLSLFSVLDQSCAMCFQSNQQHNSLMPNLGIYDWRNSWWANVCAGSMTGCSVS